MSRIHGNLHTELCRKFQDIEGLNVAFSSLAQIVFFLRGKVTPSILVCLMSS